MQKHVYVVVFLRVNRAEKVCFRLCTRVLAAVVRECLKIMRAASSSGDADFISITEACDLTATEYGLLTGYGFSATFVVRRGLGVGSAKRPVGVFTRIARQEE